MAAEEWLAWQAHMGWSDARCARELGLGSRNTVASYRVHGAPRYIALACAALAYGLPPWRVSAADPPERRR